MVRLSIEVRRVGRIRDNSWVSHAVGRCEDGKLSCEVEIFVIN